MLKAISLVLGLSVLFLVACGGEKTTSDTQGNPTSKSSSPTSGPSSESGLILEESPGNASHVKAMMDGLKNGDEVLIKGRIKDFMTPFAGFTIVDEAMKHCAENGDDACKTPWDYCCSDPNDLKAHTATVEVHEGGNIMKGDLAVMGSMNQLSDVIVKGTATMSKDGNVTVVATGIFVAKK